MLGGKKRNVAKRRRSPTWIIPLTAEAGLLNFARELAVSGVSATAGTGTARRELLRDVSFRLRRGHSAGIWGPPGCGLTTLGDILAGLRRRGPDGEVLLDRVPRQPKDVGYLRHPSSHPPLAEYHDRTVQQHLHSELCSQRVDPSDARWRTVAALHDFELDTLAARPIGTLSELQRRLVAMAAIYVHAPPIVVADEPDAELGDLDSLRVVNAFLEWGERLWCSPILLTHDSNEAQAADQTYRIDGCTLVPDVPSSRDSTIPRLSVITG